MQSNTDHFVNASEIQSLTADELMLLIEKFSQTDINTPEGIVQHKKELNAIANAAERACISYSSQRATELKMNRMHEQQESQQNVDGQLSLPTESSSTVAENKPKRVRRTAAKIAEDKAAAEQSATSEGTSSENSQ